MISSRRGSQYFRIEGLHVYAARRIEIDTGGSCCRGQSPQLGAVRLPKKWLGNGIFGRHAVYQHQKPIEMQHTQLLPPLPSTKVCDQLRERICYNDFRVINSG
jgi:hypothetical protein